MLTIYLIILILIIICYFTVSIKKETFENNLTNTNPRKIAFCFLIYDVINHEKLWYDFFKNVDKNKYSIYIHYKLDTPLIYFNDYKLKKVVKTEWCGTSLVVAQNLLLKEAMKDKMNKNFVFISNSCIPVKPFSYVYKFISPKFSYFNFMLFNYTKKQKINFIKASQWCILNRKHTRQILKNKKIQKIIFKTFESKLSMFLTTKINGCPDEYTYITLLARVNKKIFKEIKITNNLSFDATTFTNWKDSLNSLDFKKSIKTKSPSNYYFICKKELNSLIKSKSLFARKFYSNCKGLDKLSEIYD